MGSILFPDHCKTHKMRDKAVSEDLYTLQYVHDWFVTQEQVKIWYDDDDYCDDDEIVEWYVDYKNARTKKKR